MNCRKRRSTLDILTVAALLTLVIAMMLTILKTAATAGALQDAVIANSAKYLHVREINNDNRGPEINQWLKYVGLPPGMAYCAAFCVYNYFEAGFKLPKFARCATLWRTCKARELTYKTFDSELVSMGIEKLEPADIAIWRHGKGTTSDFNGHAGLILTQTGRNSFRSREGNTMPSNSGNQRDGGGVYDRDRKLGTGTIFAVIGFIRVRP